MRIQIKKFIKNSMINYSIYFALSITVISCLDTTHLQPRAESGILNLTKWNFQTQSVKLDGDWEFYPNELIYYNSFSEGKEFKKKYIQVPGIWNESLGSRFGFATYRLTILLPKDLDSSLVLKIAEMGTSYEMYVNGQRIASNGVVGKTRESSKPQFLPLITKEIKENLKLEIVCYVSNYHNRDGGIWYSILLGRENVIRDIREQKMLFTLFIYGCLFTMVLYHITIFIIRKKDKSALIFSLFCLTVFSHLLVFDEKFLNQIFTENSFLILNRIEYLSYYLAIPLFSHFLYLVFPEDFKRRMMLYIWTIAGFFISIVLISDSSIYTFTIPFYHIFTLLAMSYFIYVFFEAVKLKREGARIIFVGTIIFFIGIMNDILHSLIIIRTMYIFPQGLLVFLFSHSIVISIRFTNALSQVEKLSDSLLKINTSLEEKIFHRTKQYKLQKEKAEEANKIKDKFVSIVSHDLRSPLQGVLNLLEILTNPRLKTKIVDQKKYLNLCLNSTKLSLSMIKQLLDISRIETGSLNIYKINFLLKDFLQKILDELKPFYLIKNIKIEVKEFEDITIFADPHLFHQVISNLIVNAIKFSHANQTIHIDCNLNSKHKIISIIDNGIGMNKEQVNQILSFSYLRSNLGTLGESGSGMGFYICNYIVDAHNGKIKIKSRQGYGTEVRIILPSK